jgi:hypothetical protein
MFQVFQTYVSSVSFGCCIRCFGSIRMFQVFHMFQTYVASVSSECYKSRSRGCICCYGYTRMFKRIFQVFYLFQTYVASVSSVCLKGKSRRAHVAMASVAGGQQLATTAAGGVVVGHRADASAACIRKRVR